MNLGNARVLLTGAAGGLGSATAARLARGGAALFLADRNPAGLERLAASLQDRGTTVTWLAGDVTSPEDRQRLVTAAAEWRGGVNVVVNNAGLNDFAFLEDQDEARVEATIRVNVLAPMLLTRGLLPHLGCLPEAHVVNIGSTFGSIGYPGYATYCATKFAIRGFTEAMRRETADTAVRFHYLAPRAAKTALNSAAVNAMNEALGVAMDPPELVAEAVADVIERDRKHAYLGWPEKLFVRINALFPGLVDSSLARQLPIIKQYASGSRSGTAAEGGTPA